MKMQEKVKKKRNSFTEYLEKKDATVALTKIKRLLVEGIYGTMAYLLGFGVMLFDTSPLGLAVLCAGRRHTLAILIGLIVASLVRGEMVAVYVVMYVAAAIVRFVSGMILDGSDEEALRESVLGRLKREDEKKEIDADEKRSWIEKWKSIDAIRSLSIQWNAVFTERVRLRMATAAICSLIVSLYRVVSNGFLYYDWFAALFCAVMTPAAAFLFSIYLDGRAESRWMYLVSGAALVYSMVWSCESLWIFVFSLPLVLAFVLTLYATLRYGTAIGCTVGFLCGLAMDFLYTPAFLLSALTFSFFQGRKKDVAGIFPAVVCATVWLFYIGDVSNAFVTATSLLFGGAVFTPICFYFKRGALRDAEENERERAEVETATARRRMAGEQYESSSANLRAISEAFSTLSEMFYNLSDRFRRPGTLDLRCICDRAFDAHCADCPNKTVCWGLEYSKTLDTVNRLISRLHTRGSVTREQFPAHLVRRCQAVNDIVEMINHDCARLTGELLRNNRTEIFAMDYEATAKIISDALEEDDGEYRFDPYLEQRVSEYLRDAGIFASAVTVYGQRRRQILVRGADVEHATVTAETMRADLGEMCGIHLGRPCFEVEGGVSTMLLQARRKIGVTCAQNNVSADGGVSGDTVSLFGNKKDYFYALINDGMGSGKEAALTSNLCSVFLEKMLRAGNRAGTSLRMLNNLIRSRGINSTAECSSTVDLLELDLMTAEATFIKSGAAPGFVVRGKTVNRLQSVTAPIGILCNLDTQIKHYTVRPGDLIVMISDGIEQNDPDCKWLVSYLAECENATPDEIVYRICLHAAESENHDDCSAVALRIIDASVEE